MALINQPYLPLYAGDWLSNNKLKLCSAQAHGIMVNLMLLMHKSESYGKILLGQKFKQTPKQVENFAYMLSKLLPFSEKEILSGLCELIEERVVFLEDDFLVCKRMVRDATLSKTRSKAGKIGGEKSKNFAQANSQANTEYEYDNESEDEIALKVRGMGEGWNTKPSQSEMGLELPELKIRATIELFKISKYTDVSKEDVLSFWMIFKSQNFDGEKYYQSEAKVFSHFINWCKTQNIEKNGTHKQVSGTNGVKLGTSAARVDALKKW